MVKEARYILTDVVDNHNKFWNITLNGTSVKTQWGRVGEEGASKPFPHTSEYQAEAFFDKKCREKEKKGYKLQRTIDNGSTGSKIIVSSNLESIAKSQIRTNSPELDNLISYLAKTNAHSILAQTSMSYNDTTGLFSTPLGIVTKDAIDEARDLLIKIGDLVNAQDYDNSRFSGLLNNYLMIVPQDIGRRKPDPRVMYPDLFAVQNQNTVLDSLEASLQVALQPKDDGTPVIEQEKVFDVKLHIVQDGTVIDRIKRKYNSTRQSMHACYGLEVKKVFDIEIGHMKQTFESRGKSVGNVQELWHGTKINNVLSILAKGMMIPKSSSPHVTGRMFGDGWYASDQSTKSLNYAYGAAPGQKSGISKDTFMFLNDIALGKQYIPNSTGYGRNYPMPGYDSVFAKAGVSGVMNNEFIVYDLAQVNPTYLVQFG